MLFKIKWAIRAVFYKIFFGELKLPSYIGTPVFIKGYNRIFLKGKVRIFPGARLEVINREGSIIFKENVSIGQNLHITSADELIIGRNTVITENVMITNIDHEYRSIGVEMRKQPLIISKTTIGENCFIGFGAVIQAGTIIGNHCVIGANAVVKGVFPDYSVIAGVPAKVIKKYDPIEKIWKKA